MRVIRKSF